MYWPLILENIFSAISSGTPFSRCSFQKAPPVRGDEVGVVGLGEGAAYLVGLGGGHAGHVHDELYHLFLPDDDAAAPFQGALLQGMIVFPGGSVAVTLHELSSRRCPGRRLRDG